MTDTNFYPRSAWTDHSPGWTPLHLPTPEAFQHHTGFHTTPGSDLMEWMREFEAAEKSHDHALIASAYHRMIISGGVHDGARIEIRPWGMQGGATLGHNSVSHAICITGNFENEVPTPAALDSAAIEWAYAIQNGFVSFSAFIDSHSHASGDSTACCGANLINQLPHMRDLVHAKLHVPGPPPGPTPYPPPHPTPGPPPTIHQGSRGPVVIVWQTLLNLHAGEHLATDGIFGPATDAATRRFQANHHIGVDGIVGAQTWHAMTG